MTRDYTQPHPDAIFKDKPTRFIEVYYSMLGNSCTNDIDLSIEYIQESLLRTHELLTLKTIALFIIKPKVK